MGYQEKSTAVRVLSEHDNGARASARAFITISVDDGHPSDLKTADMLSMCRLKATFYIPRRNPERQVIGTSQIRELAAAFEVGGHTISHLTLPRLTKDAAWNEIKGCKEWLEDLLDRPALSFCYPQGKYNQKVRRLVARAGFIGARTCKLDLNCIPPDPLQAGVSTHAYQHSVAIRLRHALLEANVRGVINFWEISRIATDWELQFRRALDWVEIHGGVAHLYLHSWEIDETKEWDKLRRVFEDGSSRKGLLPVTNGELFAVAQQDSRKRLSAIVL